MKRVIISLMLLAAMLTGMISVHAAPAEVAVEVCASATEVQVGDQVDFTVLVTGTGVVAMQFNLQFPQGLSYIPNSGGTTENLAQELGVPAADWTEQSMMFTFYNDVGITFDKGTEILHFSCIAEKEGEWAVDLYELLPFDEDFAEFTPKVQVQKITVTDTQTAVPDDIITVGPADDQTTETAPDEIIIETQPVTEGESEEGTATDTTAENTVPDQDDLISEEQEEGEESQTQNNNSQENTDKTGFNWIIPVGVVAVVACVVAILVIIKKKRV